MTTVRTPELVIEVGAEVITVEVTGRRLGRIEVAGNVITIEAAGQPHSPLAHAPPPDDGTHSGLVPVTHLGEVVTHNGLVVWARDNA
jgi:hypothetical protein